MIFGGYCAFPITVTTVKANACSPWTPCFIYKRVTMTNIIFILFHMQAGDNDKQFDYRRPYFSGIEVKKFSICEKLDGYFFSEVTAKEFSKE